MIGAFQVFGADGAVPTAITGGVGKPLVATASGLCVAIGIMFPCCIYPSCTHDDISFRRFISRVLDSYDQGHAA